MTIPKWAEEWLKAERINVDSFVAFLKEKARAIDVPEDLIDAISLWIQENVTSTLSPARLLAFATLIVTEIRSGHPGYSQDHGGLV
jgi:hypothetical protein